MQLCGNLQKPVKIWVKTLTICFAPTITILLIFNETVECNLAIMFQGQQLRKFLSNDFYSVDMRCDIYDGTLIVFKKWIGSYDLTDRISAMTLSPQAAPIYLLCQNYGMI